MNKLFPISIRVDTLKAGVDEVVEELKHEDKNSVVTCKVQVVVIFGVPYNFNKSKLFQQDK